MPDVYLGDQLIEDDLYLDDDHLSRLHVNGDSLEMQIYTGGEWVTQQTWNE